MTKRRLVQSLLREIETEICVFMFQLNKPKCLWAQGMLLYKLSDLFYKRYQCEIYHFKGQRACFVLCFSFVAYNISYDRNTNIPVNGCDRYVGTCTM